MCLYTLFATYIIWPQFKKFPNGGNAVTLVTELEDLIEVVVGSFEHADTSA
jgi:hypothetical protein